MAKFDNDSDSTYIDWLEKGISNRHLDYFEYLEFKNIQPVGNGSFGSVFCANWKNTHTILALKTFNNQKSTLKEVIKEVWVFKLI